MIAWLLGTICLILQGETAYFFILPNSLKSVQLECRNFTTEKQTNKPSPAAATEGTIHLDRSPQPNCLPANQLLERLTLPVPHTVQQMKRVMSVADGLGYWLD